jgi:hypothetical protein
MRFSNIDLSLACRREERKALARLAVADTAYPDRIHPDIKLL